VQAFHPFILIPSETSSSLTSSIYQLFILSHFFSSPLFPEQCGFLPLNSTPFLCLLNYTTHLPLQDPHKESLKMSTAIFTVMLEHLKQSIQLISESQSYTLNSSHETLMIRKLSLHES
jgi:hypothetical protein